MNYSECKAEAAEASKKELEKIFKKVLNYIDNQDPEIYSKQDKEEWKKTLKQSQANWEKYRDLEIDIEIGMMMKGATGSGPSNVISDISMEKNYERVQELKNSYDLANIDSLPSHTKTKEETTNLDRQAKLTGIGQEAMTPEQQEGAKAIIEAVKQMMLNTE